ncbi:site-specific DNA-methyltransferase (adenine-specific) OS=Streptomyces microflavus OX=1919 GN=Smic_65510 PE=4 SV=1 [Streptomyces microflavus]
MELSEREIARSIDVWGADTKDEEFAFLRRSEGDGGSSDAAAVRMSKEKVYADLFRAAGTPYWRLKRVMDAWCALWLAAGREDGAARRGG